MTSEPSNAMPMATSAREDLSKPEQEELFLTTGVVRVLLLEDNSSDALLIKEMLLGCGGKFRFTHLNYLKAALECLAHTEFDVILTDLGLPDATSLEAARSLRAAAPTTALVVMTGNADEEIGCDALRYGAEDYLIKGQFSRQSLARSILFAITRHQIQRDTEQIRAQEQQLKDEFLSNVSHELRSPLAAISGFAAILQDEVPGQLNAEQHKYTGIILKNAKQLSTMVEDLLEGTRAQAGKLSVDLQCISLQDAVHDTVESNLPDATQNGIHLSAEIESNVSPAYADPTRIRQVLQNLVTNAIKFTPKGGSVQVRLGYNQQDPSRLTLQVSDTGRGIAPESIDNIFNRLYQETDHDAAGRKGLGLGLYICRQIMSRQGGNIWVESALGKGSTFFVTVPVYSLYGLISPAILHQEQQPDSLAVVTARISLPCSRRPSAEFCREVRTMLERCMLPDLDVLLPRTNANGYQDCFLILAVAKEAGAQVLVRRIQDQLKLLDEVECNAGAVSVEYKMMAAEQIQQCTSKESLAQWVALELGQLLTRSDVHEQKDPDCG